jgi:hypothetical protein
VGNPRQKPPLPTGRQRHHAYLASATELQYVLPLRAPRVHSSRAITCSRHLQRRGTDLINPGCAKRRVNEPIYRSGKLRGLEFGLPSSVSCLRVRGPPTTGTDGLEAAFRLGFKGLARVPVAGLGRQRLLFQGSTLP